MAFRAAGCDEVLTISSPLFLGMNDSGVDIRVGIFRRSDHSSRPCLFRGFRRMVRWLLVYFYRPLLTALHSIAHSAVPTETPCLHFCRCCLSCDTLVRIPEAVVLFANMATDVEDQFLVEDRASVTVQLRTWASLSNQTSHAFNCLATT